jgi:hypothetical protein
VERLGGPKRPFEIVAGASLTVWTPSIYTHSVCGPSFRTVIWGNDMKKLVIGAATLLAVAGYAWSALAACPPGTTYNCYTTANGKQSCGCR